MSYDFNQATRIPKRPAIAERRRAVRQNFSAAAEVVEVVSGARLRLIARVSDLSTGGCYLDTINPFSPETKTHLRIHHGNVSFTCVAVVKSAQIGMGMGLAFGTLDQARKDILESWPDGSRPSVPAEFSVEETWKDAEPAASQNGNGDSPEPSESAKPALSNRLVKVLHEKGLLSDKEVAELLGKDGL